MSSLAYRPEIDGLRAVAIVPVVLFHMGYAWMPGGFLGVDVFFVISGFLITSILLQEMEEGTFSFPGFWARRIRRILPALLVASLTTLTVACLVLSQGDYPTIGKQALSGLLSFANVYFWQTTGDYWGTQAEDSPLLHTWSLSVEEQFYVLFPLLIGIVIRYRPRWLERVLLLVILSSLLLFLYGTSAFPTATFYLLPARGWELASGCLLAVSYRHRAANGEIKRTSPLALVGLCLIAACYGFLPNLNGGVVLAILGAALVIRFGQTGLCHALLAQRPIVHIGKISYSLYLWHWPLLVFSRYLGYGSHRLLLFLPLYLLAITSYHFVEKPARHWRGVLPTLGVCYLLLMGFSITMATSSGRYDTSEFEKPHWYGLYYDLKPDNLLPETHQQMVADFDIPKREAPADAYLNGGIIVGSDDRTPPRIVVLGDSHGVMWSDAIRQVVEKLAIKTSFYSMNGLSPFMDLPLSSDPKLAYRYQYDQARLDFLRTWQPELVIVCARWSTLRESEAADLLGFLEEHSAHVLLMEQPPELTFGNTSALQVVCSRKMKPEPGVRQYLPMDRDKGELSHSLVRTLAGKYRNCDYIPTFDLFAHDSQALVLDGKRIVYVDNDHLTTHGARLAIPRLEQEISELFKGPVNSPERGIRITNAENNSPR